MTLKEKIQNDTNEAMKSKDDLRVSVLRLLKTAISKFEVAGEQKKEATDEEILQLINKEVKQRRDSIEAYRKGGREDLASKEEAELKILQSYLPAQMSEEEIRMVVTEVIIQVKPAGKQDFGKVMGQAMGRLKGRAEGNVVNKIVSELLLKG